MSNSSKSKQLFDKMFPETAALKEKGLCPGCKNPTSDTAFSDELSIDEFIQSGMCQECQDEIFVEYE